MSTFVQLFKNLGARTVVTWSEAGPSGLATLDCLPLNYAGIVGGESITMARDGGPATAVNFLAGDVNRNLIVNRINATFPGFAMNAPDGAGIRLQADSLSVTSSTQANFNKLGIPIMARDKTQLTRDYILLDGNGDCFDRIDRISNPIAIPDGANELTLWSKYFVDAAGFVSANPLITLGWGNGTEGVGPFTSLVQVPSDSIEIVPPYDSVVETDPSRLIDVGTSVRVMVGAVLDNTLYKTLRMKIPAGATTFYVVGAKVLQGDSATYPIKSPKFQAAVTFGARLD